MNSWLGWHGIESQELDDLASNKEERLSSHWRSAVPYLVCERVFFTLYIEWQCAKDVSSAVSNK